MRKVVLGLMVVWLLLAACQGNGSSNSSGTTNPPSGNPTNPNPNPQPPAPPPVVPPNTPSNLWSDTKTWEAFGIAKPKAGDSVTVPAGKRVVLDENTPELAGLTILGELEFARKDLNLTADWIMLHGALKVGSEAQPFAQKATLTLKASDTAQSIMEMGTRGILLMEGGQLSLFGAKPNLTRTKINANAAVGATSLTLQGKRELEGR